MLAFDYVSLIHIFLRIYIPKDDFFYGKKNARIAKEGRRRRKIKCVISFRHQSASNRRDLELNSLLPTRHTTLFTTIITYISSCRLKERRKRLFMLRIYCIKYRWLFGAPRENLCVCFNSRNTLQSNTNKTMGKAT